MYGICSLGAFPGAGKILPKKFSTGPFKQIYGTRWDKEIYKILFRISWALGKALGNM